jgi:O-antigen/teichoic acid export membrane protein
MNLASLLRVSQIDRPVAYSILGNFISLLFGSLTVWLIANYLSLETQGYYYAFAGLISLQFILELGLGQTVIPFASHEWAHLGLNKEGQIVGDINAQARLLSMGRLLFKWYSLSAGIVLLCLTPAGYLFFNLFPSSEVEWRYPWIVLCSFIALNLWAMPIFYLLQGCNQVTSYGFYRLIQQIAYGVCVWAMILLGGDLWTFPAAAAMIFIWSCVFIWKYHFPFFLFFFYARNGKKIDWWGEIWPTQWRTAISWLSSNFITSFFSPLLFYLSSPKVAGQVGLTIAVHNLLLAVSSSWVSTKFPRFGMLISKGDYKELDHLFKKSMVISGGSMILGSSAILCGIYTLHFFDHPLKIRILPPLLTGLLLLGGIFASLSIHLSFYLRAHKKDPLAIPFLITGFLILALGIHWGKGLDALGVSIAYLGVSGLFQFPLSLYIFYRFRRDRDEVIQISNARSAISDKRTSFSPWRPNSEQRKKSKE